MRINFHEIFNVNTDGSIESKGRTVKIGGVQFGPGARFKNVSFGGIDLSKYIGRDLEVREENDVYIIIGIY
ncbi:MAG: hypothetical protein UR31_C0002G0013 [Parcubacteria group bacterium GW2011_GWA2_33_14]|uniref:Uncharacterized protein n=1 Tax=Candidatus Staskawiczbacteria bacterium RIFCSPHIGHO2_02_FULL_33_16 TaxID=1802204 RepID=A0A1G2HVN7_9BACT|nr:MAG: hypothetical protein UR31_C0002G0013 [Parcubacteria group bacterium GW2011_GWA2_33_14]OGZ66527.1 MAG: hypothetical protein A3D34_00650 [Candidatus Staskawiczbacteria bacterium RIFCSPHIGHO2_02_FULL_33_16]OGZ70067.1 MAG: hypothetical protein A2980_01570 [Candidatus Staskawiczbacteria bacterium RIFCSPLOWO2_01_FULL_33_13]